MGGCSEAAAAELARLRGRLVVSCQAREGNPLHGPAFMAAMAEAAVLGGAAGIRADGAASFTACSAPWIFGVMARASAMAVGRSVLHGNGSAPIITQVCSTEKSFASLPPMVIETLSAV